MLNLLDESYNSGKSYKNICSDYDEYLSENDISLDENNMPLAPSFFKKL